MFDYMAWVPKTYCGQVAGMAWKIGNLAAKAATGANIAKLIADKIREYVDLNGASTTRSCMPQLVISPVPAAGAEFEINPLHIEARSVSLTTKTCDLIYDWTGLTPAVKIGKMQFTMAIGNSSDPELENPAPLEEVHRQAGRERGIGIEGGGDSEMQTNSEMEGE